MFEVKTKNQGHNAEVFSKEKGFRSKNRKSSAKFKRSPKKKQKRYSKMFCKVSGVLQDETK